MRVFADASSVELFVDDGLGVMTEIFFPTIPFDKLWLSVDDNFEFERIEVHELEGIW